MNPMDATLHSIIAAQYTQERIAQATAARAARSVQSPRRRFFRKAGLDTTADASRPVSAPARTAFRWAR
jgi:hypothetical protein